MKKIMIACGVFSVVSVGCFGAQRFVKHVAPVKESVQATQTLLDSLYKNISGFAVDNGERKKIELQGGAPTYGEIRYESVATLVEKLKLTKNDVFYDLGSGVGKAVVQIYLTSPVKRSVGIELSKTRHAGALSALGALKKSDSLSPKRELSFVMEDITKADIHDATVVFMCSTCFSDKLMKTMTDRLAQLKPGLRVLTLKKLPDNPKFILKDTYSLPMTWSKASDVYLYQLQS